MPKGRTYLPIDCELVLPAPIGGRTGRGVTGNGGSQKAGGLSAHSGSRNSNGFGLMVSRYGRDAGSEDPQVADAARAKLRWVMALAESLNTR
jgi:hypothetical protein